MCYDQFVPGFSFNPTACLNHERLFDCNHDDYFHTDPPAGNYLDTHWNTADSQYLSSTPEDHWGFVHADDRPRAPPTPRRRPQPELDRHAQHRGADRHRRLSGDVPEPGQLRRQSGSAAATAVGTAGEHCTVSSWNSNGTPDMAVTVRCFSAAGAPADTRVRRHLHPPDREQRALRLPVGADPAAAAYTPSTNHQFNSTGATNTIVRNSTGDYTVTLPAWRPRAGRSR